MVSLFGAGGIGLGIGVVVAVVLAVILSGDCVPEEDCLAVAGGLSYGLLSGSVAALVAVIVLSVRYRVASFGIGAAVALLLFIGPGLLLQLDNASAYVALSVIVLITGAVLSRYLRNRPSQENAPLS